MQKRKMVKRRSQPCRVLESPGDRTVLAVTGGPGSFWHFRDIGGRGRAAGWDCHMQGGIFSDSEGRFPSDLAPQLGRLP